MKKNNEQLMVNFETPLLQKCNNGKNNGLGTCQHAVGTSIMFISLTIALSLGLDIVCTCVKIQ